ncbi:hypothetical protein CSQ89_03685 [Chitinimonas sp. BJB300]|nr:hypothetical protein CSQ89_03685 [Chitinimonas sp. BJB300]TSJ88054.1 hypothetical protein FG002_011010 [Chitinimonas sp. BJB300]
MLNKNLLRKLDIQDVAIFLSLIDTNNARLTAERLRTCLKSRELRQDKAKTAEEAEFTSGK